MKTDLIRDNLWLVLSRGWHDYAVVQVSHCREVVIAQLHDVFSHLHLGRLCRGDLLERGVGDRYCQRLDFRVPRTGLVCAHRTHAAEFQSFRISHDRQVSLIGRVEVNPILVFKYDLKCDVVNGIELLPRTVQRNFDAHARILELIFETITVDFHLSQSHDGFIVKPVVLRFDFATMFDWLILRLDSGGLEQQYRTAAQSKQDVLHVTSPNARIICRVEMGRTVEEGSQAT